MLLTVDVLPHWSVTVSVAVGAVTQTGPLAPHVKLTVTMGVAAEEMSPCVKAQL